MSDPSSDQKIELLVRSVLEAVDARLAEVRSDVQRLAADVGQRLQVLEQRVEVEIANCAGTSVGVASDPGGLIHERLDALSAALDQLRDNAVTPVGVAHSPSPSPSMMFGLDEMSAPIRMPTITGQHPVLLDEPPHLALPAEESEADAVTDELVTDDVVPDELVTDDDVESTFEPTSFEPAPDDPPITEPTTLDDSPAPIDLNQLADLLSERLSSISLPPR